MTFKPRRFACHRAEEDGDATVSLSSSVSYSKREPLSCLENRIRELHRKLGDQALVQALDDCSLSPLKVVTMVVPEPYEWRAPSFDGSSVSTISSSSGSSFMSRLPRTRSFLQMYSNVGIPLAPRTTSNSKLQDNGWGYFADVKDVESPKVAPKYRNFMTIEKGNTQRNVQRWTAFTWHGQ